MSSRSDDLIQKASATIRAIAKTIAELEADPENSALSTRKQSLQQELGTIQAELQEESDQQLDSIKREFGVSDEVIQAFNDAHRPELDDRYWANEIQDVPTTVKLEDVVARGYDRILSVADPDWLREQSRQKFRQRYDDQPGFDCRLHLVGRQRLLPTDAPAGPQRFAHMLLLCDDFLRGRHDLDIFDGPMLVSEAAALGNSLTEIGELGSEANKKLKSLSSEKDREVASTVYELLVGAACIRNGFSTEMLEASNTQKTPDLRVHSLVVPMVVECKRRLGLNTYSEKEARHVEGLFESAKELFEDCHPLVEVTFHSEVFSVSAEAFITTLRPMCNSWDEDVEQTTPWGTLRLRRLPSVSSISSTRVFSPVFLKAVFDWDHVMTEWDGLLCEIAPTNAPVVSQVSWPRGLKWRCEAERSQLKKARGLTSLWGEAVQQIPSGEVGCVYIAYTEGMRPEIADARTNHLFESVKNKDLYHRGSIMVPLTMVNRLYPQALGNGGIELIESAMPLTLDGHEFMLEDWPFQVFTRLR